MVGSTIAGYRVLAELGEGAMGRVYKAEDIRLRKPVALKFLSHEAAGDAEFEARMEREAQAAASLDHPNVCQVYGLHEHDGESFIAMAFVDGPTLADKLEQRPLPLDEALDLAVQIAEGLQEAHEKGVVHRDIKPANVMLTAKGQVKITDFGLARIDNRSSLTQADAAPGTLLYMAPELISGGKADRRSDLWAVGCVLYEMLVQKSPFDGEYSQAVAYSIANEEPEPVTALRAGLPTEIDRILSKTLAKDPAQRYQHADDLLVDLRGLQQEAPKPPPAPSGLPWWKSAKLAWGLAVGLPAALLIFLTQGDGESGQGPLRKYSLEVSGQTPRLATISPNGRYIAYRAGSLAGGSLWVHDFDRGQDRELLSDRAVQTVGPPAWSPDSRILAFGVGTRLQTIDVHGGSPATLCSVSHTIWGCGWSLDGGQVFFSALWPVRRFHVSATGGDPESTTYRSDDFLPGFGGIWVIERGHSPGRGTPALGLLNTETGEKKPLDLGKERVGALSYSPTGHLVYATEGGLWALPFDEDRLEATGEVFRIVENGEWPSISSDGVLVYTESSTTGLTQLAWVDRDGLEKGRIGQPRYHIRDPDLSPDEAEVALIASDAPLGAPDVWVVDVELGATRRLTSNPERKSDTRWRAPGDQITYVSYRHGNANIYEQPADGSGEERPVLETTNHEWAEGWTRNGKTLLLTQLREPLMSGLYSLQGDELEELVRGETYDQLGAALSPNGRFLAWTSRASGSYEVYVQPFPNGGRRQQVSTNGGRQPRWRADGEELFYIQGDTLMAVRVATDLEFEKGVPEPLFESPGSFDVRGQQYDVSADGSRFVVIKSAGDPDRTSIRVVENWYEEFRSRK